MRHERGHPAAHCGRTGDAASESTDAFADLGTLLALITDAPACKKRLAELEAAMTKVERSQSKLDADTRKHAEAVAAFDARRAEVDRLKADLKAAKSEVGMLSDRINADATAEFLNRRRTPVVRLSLLLKTARHVRNFFKGWHPGPRSDLDLMYL